MKKYAIVFLLFVATVFVVRFVVGGSEDTWICDKKSGEWVEHGKPSAPKPDSPCGESTPDKSTVGEVENDALCDDGLGNEMSYSRAKEIATGTCKNGTLEDFHYCNNVTGTWWIDFSPDEPKEGCNPACVVNVKSGEAEINWRCTGLIPQE